jgi:Fanconi anemia group M protein
MLRRDFTAIQGIMLTAQSIKIMHALELLETQTLRGLFSYMSDLKKQAEEKKSKAVQILVNSGEFAAAILSLKRLLDKGVEHPKIEEISRLIELEFKSNPNSKIIIFSQYRDTSLLISEKINKIPGIKSTIFIGQAKKKNLGLNQKEQRQIIEKFRSGELNVICATSIGEEGLDIPEVSAVIFYEPIPSAIRKIQRAGRTARLSKGKLIILVTKETRDEINHFASIAREKKMYRLIEEVKRELKNKPKTLSDYK